MPSTREIVSAIYGAWLLLRFDARGLEFFEDSVPAFWRSFFAAAIVAPGHAVLVALHFTVLESQAGAFGIVVIELLSYAILWTAFPVALYQVARGIGREDRYVIAVVALNWSAVIQIVISLPAHVVTSAGVLPAGISGLLTFAVFVVLVVYEWFVMRTALNITPMGAAGIVFLDVALSFLIRFFTDAALI